MNKSLSPQTPSKLQDDVISELPSIGQDPEVKFLTTSGYRLGALVEVNRKKPGIEVDGPTHFVGKKQTENDEIPIISMPNWELTSLARKWK